MSVVLGIDAGGTRTRAVLADHTGREHARALGDGANPNSSPDARAALTAVLTEVAGGRQLDAVVLGMAGAGPAGLPMAREVLADALAVADVQAARAVVCSDVEIAYAAGTTSPRGSLLIAGTGAVAARMDGFAVTRRVDGHGYLVGDAGSAVWIGVAAARAVLGALEGRGAPTTLITPVLDLARGGDPGLDDAQALVAAVYAHRPAWMGALAPLVESAANHGDPVAVQILDSAVRELVTTVELSRIGLPADAPLVVTGAVAAGEGRVGTDVRAELRDRTGVAPVVVRQAVGGAVATALRLLPGVGQDVIAGFVEVP